MVIPLSFVISKLLIFGEHKKTHSYFKKLHGGTAGVPVLSTEADCRPRATAFDGAIAVNGTIEFACLTGWCGFRWARSVAIFECMVNDSTAQVDRLVLPS